MKDPSPMTLNFNIGDRPVSYVSLSKVASVVNRRFYRAGTHWVVGGFRFGITDGSTANVFVRTAPLNWTTTNAWQMAYSKWKRQQDEALADSNSEETKGRYNDFKVYMDTIHRDLEPIQGDLLPVSPGGVNVAATPYLPPEEWLYSEIVLPNDGAVGVTNQYLVTLLGQDSAFGGLSKSCVQGYIESRNVPQSPDPVGNIDVGNSWLNKMYDDGDNNLEITNNAQFRNNELPYDQDVYPGQAGNGGEPQLHQEIAFTTSSITNHKNMAGCLVPFGLLQVSHNHVSEDATTLTMQIMLVPGEHRGYLAESALE